ncbi:MAG: hypothetical protein ACRDLO_02660, partial [Solirubrobacterales bacterium]
MEAIELALAWVAFPAVLIALSLGCGLLVARLVGAGLAGALVPAAGCALIVVVAGFLTLADATAELATPAVVALALAGLALGRRSLGRPSGWALVAAGGVFAVYAAPIVLSGEATFAGYIRLDDTATWLALTDRVLEHGRDLDGLAPSTYEATLAFNLADGYPVGVFLPLGVASRLLGVDVAWLIQPYLAFLAALLALALWALARAIVPRDSLRAAIAFIGAQSALLFGYYLWGGVKELTAAMLIAATAACLGGVVAARFDPRALLAPALFAAALVGVLSAGGLLWLAPALVLVGALALRALPVRAVAARAALLGGLIALLALPVLATGGLLPPTSAPLTDADARGNLIGALEPAQVAGVWPAGDFRLDPVAELPAYVLIALMVGAAGAGLLVAARARDWGALAYVGGTLLAGLAIWLLGSPWVDAKALATAAPAVPFAAGLAVAALFARGFALVASVLGLALAAGVIWSNALAYRDANLAPRDQLAELERIGGRIAGEGPTLLTEYQPYGARHFLRDADPEAASELRRRRIARPGGDVVPKGEAVDTDALDPRGLLVYRTLVLRRSPAQSRPPGAYRLDWRGDFYEVWQRGPVSAVAPDRLALGNAAQPVARPLCTRVEELAARASPGARLIAAARPPLISTSLEDASYPRSWSTPRTRNKPVPEGAGTIEARVEVERAGRYEIWVAGSVRPAVRLAVDGEPAGAVRHQLNNDGQYVRLGEAELTAGEHTVEIGFAASDLHPGSGGAAAAVGPLVLSVAEAAETKLVRVAASDAATLCDRAWDWIE